MSTRNISVEIQTHTIEVAIENANVDYLHKTIEIPFIIDGGGTPITMGQKGHLKIPWPGTIVQCDVYVDQPGSIVLDIWKDTYANFPPTVADSICGSAKPTLTNVQKYKDSALTGWITSIASDDVLAYNVVSASLVTRVIVTLKVIRV